MRETTRIFLVGGQSSGTSWLVVKVLELLGCALIFSQRLAEALVYIELLGIP